MSAPNAPDARELTENRMHRAIKRAHCHMLISAAVYQKLVADLMDAADYYHAAAPQPPHWAGLTSEALCDATDKPDHAEDAYICTSQDGHAPPHLAHDADGRIMHAWEDA